jgi:hypothetical protein
MGAVRERVLHHGNEMVSLVLVSNAKLSFCNAFMGPF